MTPSRAHYYFMRGISLDDIAASANSKPIHIAKAIGAHVDQEYARYLR